MSTNIISRPVYIEQLKNFINKPQVKIITGIRRSGKSTVLSLLREELLNMGINEEQVIQVNFESFAFSELSTPTNRRSGISSFAKH